MKGFTLSLVQLYNAIIKTTVKAALVVSVVFCFFVFAPAPQAYAQTATNTITDGLEVVKEPLGLPSADIRVIIARIIRVALGMLGIVFLVLVLYGGYLWMTAGGNPEQIESSKKILTNATIGLAIILSAYAIVLFVMRLLGISTGDGTTVGGGVGVDQNYAGSAGLGAVIKDHYPTRDQLDVPRNSKIIITFFKPIKMDTLTRDTNTKAGATPVYGDCVNVGSQMRWESDCDQLNLDAITISRADTDERISGAAVLASYENKKVYTIVIRPLDNLGNEQEKIPYKVRVTNNIRFDNAASGNPTIFSGKSDASNFYEWKFTADTKLDLQPPHVTSVYPDKDSVEVKNSVIQVFFNDAMDPTGIQGTFTTSGNHYVLNGENIFLKTNNSSVPLGTMRLTNGYRALEFTPSRECGENACGGKIYCLSVCDKPGATCKEDTYDILLKAATTFSGNSFESVPFSGLMDVAGNALDSSNPYGDKPRSATTTQPVFDNWKEPDNYFWNFTIKDEMDLTSPYMRSNKPGISQAFVGPYDEWSMTFSKRLRIESAYTIGIDEKPESKDANGDVVTLCRAPRVDNFSGYGYVRMEHCPFLDASRHYYYPVVSSDVEDVHFNCFYPGKGPLLNGATCDENNNFCCNVTSTPQSQATCCNGVPGC